MKLAPLLSILAPALAQIVTAGDLICPTSDANDCYPLIFEATNEFQPIREGQQIPAGLHVRMNIETGAQEARIMQEEGDKPSELAVVEDKADADKDTNKDADKETELKIQEALENYKKQQKEFIRSKVSDSELQDFASSIAELEAFGEGADISRAEKALDTLIELSHDIEFGARLTHNPRSFAALPHLALLVDDTNLQEKAYRIMGSTLRNNPEAVSNVLSLQPRLFAENLFDVLTSPDTPAVVQKRVLGVIQALATDKTFAYEFFNSHSSHHSSGFNVLVYLFPKTAKDVQQRIVNILEDLSLVDNKLSNGDKESIEASVRPENKVSAMLQRMLMEGKASSEDQFKLLFGSLSTLHRDSQLQPQKDFVVWLSEEVEKRRNGIRERDHLYSSTDEAFDEAMLEARHEVFGNAYSRKMDEL